MTPLNANTLELAGSPNGTGFCFADDLGPSKIVEITQPAIGLKACVVVDNVACGPAIGGVRMAPDAGLEECFRLARAMTLKNAAAGLPHGGGKSVIVADPHGPRAEKERLVRAFAASIRDLSDYIPGPDMGTDETAMAWVHDEIGRAVGLPPEIGGIPLDEIGATGFGLAVASEVAAEHARLALEGARVAVQGFGSVGKHAARFLIERGAVLVGAADSKGTVSDPDGLDLESLLAHKARGGSMADCPTGQTSDRETIVEVDCDIWIPAARPDVLRADNVDRLRAKLVIQGANIPVTPEAEATLHERKILSVPDFIANAGGVICGSVEYHGGTQTGAIAAIEEKVRANTEACLAGSTNTGRLPRETAVELARHRVLTAMSYERWSLA